MKKLKPVQHGLLFLMKVTLIHILLTSFSIMMAYAVDSWGQRYWIGRSPLKLKIPKYRMCF